MHHCALQVGVHSALANKCVAELLARQLIPGLPEYAEISAEVALARYLGSDKEAAR